MESSSRPSSRSRRRTSRSSKTSTSRRSKRPSCRRLTEQQMEAERIWSQFCQFALEKDAAQRGKKKLAAMLYCVTLVLEILALIAAVTIGAIVYIKLDVDMDVTYHIVQGSIEAILTVMSVCTTLYNRQSLRDLLVACFLSAAIWDFYLCTTNVISQNVLTLCHNSSHPHCLGYINVRFHFAYMAIICLALHAICFVCSAAALSLISQANKAQQDAHMLQMVVVENEKHKRRTRRSRRKRTSQKRSGQSQSSRRGSETASSRKSRTV